MHDTTINEILGDFSPMENSGEMSQKERRPVTIWLPINEKARYDQLQKRSGRKFSKKAREALLALIEIAEKRTI